MCSSPKQKTSSTSTFTPTAAASGIYNQAIDSAQNLATSPYDPAMDASAAGFSADQNAAFQGVRDAQGAWQPFFDQSADYATGAAGPISGEQISGYMDPYIQQVIDATLAQTNRQDSIEQARLRGSGVATGALGGNAGAVNSAVLAGEQGRNRNAMIAQLLSGGYGQALSAAQQDAQRQMAAAGHFGQLGQSTQQALYNDTAARLQAGNQQQAQEQRVLDTDTANAQQQYIHPYQQTQWLASIGAGLGPLTGGTTTGNSETSQKKGTGQIIGGALTTAAMLSDRGAKEDITRVGFTDDGQPLYKFRYKGDPKFQIGLMADEVEETHPEAVSTGPHGMDMVDYDKATPYADGGGVFGNSGVFGSDGVLPWAEIRPASLNAPSLPSAPQQSGSGADGGDLTDLSGWKGAGDSINSLWKQFDPAGGWGASIEPASGASAGKGVSSLFGFARGGEIPDQAKRGFRLADVIDVGSGGQDVIDVYGEFLPEARRMFVDGAASRMGRGVGFNGADEMVSPDPMTPGLQIGTMGGFAAGGSIYSDIELPERRDRFAIPEGKRIIAPYGTLPGDDFIGEVGPSGIEPEMLPMVPEHSGITKAVNVGEAGPSGIKPEVPWYMQSLTDMLGITEGKTDPNARLTMPKRPAPPRDPLVPNAPQVQNPEPSADWSLDGGTIRRNGMSFADWMAGRDGPPAAPEQPVAFDPFANPSPYDPAIDTPEMMPQPKAQPAPATPETGSGALNTLDFIKEQEGYTPVAKWDNRQFSSGYGTRAQEGERIDRAEAERRLAAETAEVEKWIDRNITSEMTPQQRTGLVSFGYNLGTDDLDKLKGDINAGDWGRVASRMRSFNKALNKDTQELEVVDGLTNRRLREAALVSGGAGLPEGVAELPPQMSETASKGYAKSTDGGQAYRGSEDRQTGGLLKRMFGFDFNPLNLSEDERMAMLVSGLSMMSHGDVGRGGLAGLQYLSNKNSADRKTAIEMAKLGLKERQYADKTALDLLKIESDRTKPTNDMREYQFAQSNEGFQGTFLDFMRDKKAASASGGSAEVKARAGMAKGFYEDVPSIKTFIRGITMGDRADLQLGRGKAAEAWRRIETGRDALIRNMTGAAMPEQEAQNYAQRYQILPTDRVETMLQKVDLLERDLRKSFEHLQQYQQSQGQRSTGARPQARNAAGDVMEFDGASWVPVRKIGMEARP